jgi:hypothetical protein
MFIGHVAIALVAKRARESVPLAALLAATFGPDVIEITLLAFERWVNLPTSLGSHSIPAVALGAAAVGTAYWLKTKDRRGGAVLSGVYASHWAADLITGTGKPTWLGGPKLGLSLYDYPLIDFVFESTLLLAAWLLAWPARNYDRRRAVQVTAPVALMLLQLAFNASQHLFGLQSLKSAVSNAGAPGDPCRAAVVRCIGSAGPG